MYFFSLSIFFTFFFYYIYIHYTILYPSILIPSHPYYLLSSTEELKSICKTYQDRIVSLENLKYDFEYVVKRKDIEVHTTTKSYIQNYNFFTKKKKNSTATAKNTPLPPPLCHNFKIIFKFSKQNSKPKKKQQRTHLPKNFTFSLLLF